MLPPSEQWRKCQRIHWPQNSGRTYRFQFHNLLACCKLFSCSANGLKHYTVRKERWYTLSYTERLTCGGQRGQIRSGGMKRSREIIVLARITLFNPPETAAGWDHWDSWHGSLLHPPGNQSLTTELQCLLIFKGSITLLESFSFAPCLIRGDAHKRPGGNYLFSDTICIRGWWTPGFSI